MQDPEGEYWCSTRTDSKNKHVGGGGHWGYCKPGCDVKPVPTTTTTRTTTTTTQTTVLVHIKITENNAFV